MVFQSYALFPHIRCSTTSPTACARAACAGRGARAGARGARDPSGSRGSRRVCPSSSPAASSSASALARALVLEPAALLFDEPLSNLDARAAPRVRDEIRAAAAAPGPLGGVRDPRSGGGAGGVRPHHRDGPRASSRTARPGPLRASATDSSPRSWARPTGLRHARACGRRDIVGDAGRARIAGRGTRHRAGTGALRGYAPSRSRSRAAARGSRARWRPWRTWEARSSITSTPPSGAFCGLGGCGRWLVPGTDVA